MRLLTLMLCAASILPAADTLQAFGKQWGVVNAADWSDTKENGAELLSLLKNRGPLPGPRRPIQFAIAETPMFHSVRIELDTRPKQRSLMIVFAYRDGAHFNYAHLSVDKGSEQTYHNGIFHVYGGERVRISSEAGPAAFAASGRWYHVVLDWSGKTGEIRTAVDGQEIPALHAVDLSHSSGKVGLGSFDETGDFRNVKITGTE
jgi:hypothetical protein